MDNPTISVVISTYNAAETLHCCINSYVAQTYPNKELIIVDGASQDSTLLIIESFGQHVTRYISEPDTGIYNAWNKALCLTSGEWLYFLGADDYFVDPQALQKVAKLLAGVPAEINVAYGKVEYVNSAGDFLYSRGAPWERVGARYRQLMTIPHQGVFHRHRLFRLHGSFDETLRIAGDYEMLLRELKDKPAVFMPISICAMRQSGISAQSGNSLLIMREIRWAQQKNDIRFAGIYWYLALLRVYIRKALWRVLGERLACHLLDFGRWLMGKPSHWTKNIIK